MTLKDPDNLIYRQLSGGSPDKINSHFGFRGSQLLNTSSSEKQIKLSTLHNENEIIMYNIEELNDENF